MALQRDTKYPGRFTTATTAHPQGPFKNRTTSTSQDGSYLEKDWLNDWDGFFGSLLSKAGLTPDGNVDAVGASQYFTALQKIFASGQQKFTSSDSFTVPDNIYTIYVSAIGGGGGGGGGGGRNSLSNAASGGAGGGAGQSIQRVPFAVTPGQVIPITIGGAGTAGPAGTTTSNGGTGGTGGNTVVGSLVTLTGGNGGAGGSSNMVTQAVGGDGGAGYPKGGDASTLPATTYGYAGSGASSPFGGGGMGGRCAGTSTTAGGNSFGYGCGGGGGGCVNAVTYEAGKAGGLGTQGMVLIEW